MMKKINKLLLSVAIAGLCGGAMAKPVESDNEAWKAKFPNQYDSWASSAETDQIVDLLADDPNLVVLWAGYGFSKDYNKARGHYYAVTDVIQTLRTGAPMNDTDGPMPAACWSCKSPDVARMYQEVGEGNFNDHKFGKWGHEMGNAIGCADCHESGTPKLTLSRPYAERAMEKVDLTFSEQSRDMKAAQTCGQCHVEYYFDKNDHNNVRFPWENGFTAEGAEKYFDSIGFADWTHKISKAPMLKAQHPEFETWATSVHAEMDVTCITCHMPKVTNDQGRKFSKHNVGNALDNFDVACSSCHDSQADLKATLKANKEAINAEKLKAEAIIVRAHFEAGAAWEAGATEAEMKQALIHIRHAQWRWDFAIASHGVHAHNPQEALRLLASAQEIGLQAQAELKKVLTKYGVAQPVAIPDISTKEAAQALVGWDKAKLDAQKEAFLEQRVDKEWPERN
ncbi:ammonia-forming cytochrome c nitrite reductase [Ferrimonas balearica]|uniref:ammonia-forming cytochrome c nitrite reductase n=1 Tax=Ferrimonas balearica TaxID=44012 RepID=UPI003CCFEA52